MVYDHVLEVGHDPLSELYLLCLYVAHPFPYNVEGYRIGAAPTPLLLSLT